jgi:hypothetical protein
VAYFALKKRIVAIFRAFQGSATPFGAKPGAVLIGVCSIFYMAIV